MKPKFEQNIMVSLLCPKLRYDKLHVRSSKGVLRIISQNLTVKTLLIYC